MATQSGQGMQNQGSMAQGVWGKGQQPAGAPPTGIAPHGNVPPGTVSYPEQTMGSKGGGGGYDGPAGGAGGNMPDPRVGTPPPGAQVPTQPGVPGTPTPGAPAAPATPGAPQAPLPPQEPRPGPVPPGTVSPSGTPVNPDGSFTNPDGGKDWMVGYGPSMSFGGQESRTGRAPTTPNPGDPDQVTGGARGTPAWRQAYAAHDAWIRSQLDAGLHLADLGLSPTRGGGLSAYMRYGGYQPAGGGGAPAPGTPAAPQPAGPNTGGGLPGTTTYAPTSNVVPGNMQYGGGQLDSVIRALLGMGQGQ